jgi:hypothetical protein
MVPVTTNQTFKMIIEIRSNLMAPSSDHLGHPKGSAAEPSAAEMMVPWWLNDIQFNVFLSPCNLT